MGLTRLPVNNPVISQPFGENPTRYLPASHPLIIKYGNYQPYGHDGIDFACPTGTPVFAAGPGVLAFSGWGRSMPNDVALKYGFTTVEALKWTSGLIAIIDHGPYATYYAHMSRTDLDHLVGRPIGAGTLLGLSGNTGRSGGPHLHWSAVTLPVNYSDGLYSRRNPLDFVTVRTVTPINLDAVGSGAPSTSKEPFTVTQYENIMRELGNIKSVLASPGGFTWDGKHYPSISAVQIENQRRINAIPDRIWRETVVHRGGEEVPVLQDLADGTTHAGRAAELVKTLQGLTDEDLAKIATLIDAVKGEVTVKVITDREGAPK